SGAAQPRARRARGGTAEGPGRPAGAQQVPGAGGRRDREAGEGRRAGGEGIEQLYRGREARGGGTDARPRSQHAPAPGGAVAGIRERPGEQSGEPGGAAGEREPDPRGPEPARDADQAPGGAREPGPGGGAALGAGPGLAPAREPEEPRVGRLVP